MDTPVSLGPFLGINNRLEDDSLAVSDSGGKAGDYLKDAVNVELNNSGMPQRRDGSVKAIAGVDCHSLFGLKNNRALYIDHDKLMLAMPTGVGSDLTVVELLSGLTPGAPMSYTAVGDVVYLSNGVDFWRFENNQIVQHAMPSPAWMPHVAASDVGSLPAGDYQVAVAYLSNDGLLTAPTPNVAICLDTDGAIVLGNIPAVFPTGVQSAMVYVTPCNGDVLYQAAKIFAGMPSFTLPVLPDGGARCPTENLRPLPPGRILRSHHARLISAYGSVLSYSQPFASALHDPTADYLVFPADITMIEHVDGGIYVATTEKTYWLAGDVAGTTMVEILPYGAAFGSSSRKPTDGGVVWWSDRGLIVASASGEVRNAIEGNLKLTPSATASVFVREHKGMDQVVAATQGGGEASVAALRSFMDVEVIRKEDR